MSFAHEIIGKQLRVVNSTKKDFVELEGKILDESKEMIFVLVKGNKQVKILKRCLLEIEIIDQEEKIISLHGRDFLMKPWDRIKG